MASDKGPVVTEASPLPSSTISQPSISPAPISVEALQADATRATASLKRAREATPTSPTSSALAVQLSSELSPTKAARLIGATSRHSNAPLTAAAAIEEEQRQREEQYKLQVSGDTENPAYKVQSELMSAGVLTMSRPQEAPMDDSQSLEHPAMSISESAGIEGNGKTDVSPQSATSMASLGSGAAPVSTSPGHMELDRVGYAPQPQAQMEEKGNGTSMSYPGLLPTGESSAMPAPPARGMSFPMTPGQQGAPRSPSSKRHKCPYCETEFTRHHNLKSHLLTHSQEKPYACQTCQMRFRRLHDLKRHSKLHTGEKPHVCPKCDRKFARGDALARHSKGPGGCVSRRGSLGFGDEDLEGGNQLEGDDSTMSGVVYDGLEVADMTEEDRRRLSLPSIKAQHVQGNQTYPPTGSAVGRLYPPNVDRGSVSSNAANANPSTYAQTGMTESPKPLSPSGLQGHDGNIARQRSPSLTTQFQQQHFGRHQGDRSTPPGSYHHSPYSEALEAQLLSVPGFTGTDARYAASGQAGAQGTAPTSQGGSGAVIQPATMASSGGAHSRTSSGLGQNGGSGDSTSNNIFATDQGIWVYINNLEESLREVNGRVQSLEQTERTQEERIHILEQNEKNQEEKIIQLTAELFALRDQLDAKTKAEEAPTSS